MMYQVPKGLVVLITTVLLAGCGTGLTVRDAEIVPEVPDETTEVDPMDGYVEMDVADVLSTDSGPVVVLVDPTNSLLLPIWIGSTEALVIALRLDGQAFERPLTHDLVDALLRELGGELVSVKIDNVQGSTFVATLEIRAGERMFLLDSRASDSIAMALGQGIPIYVADRVLIDSAIPAEGPEDVPTMHEEAEPKQPIVQL